MLNKLPWNKLNDKACPGCGVKRHHCPRYPRKFCLACRDTAVDSRGRYVETWNTCFGGGFGFGWRGEGTIYSAGGLIALINGQRVYFSEARFGGTVVQCEDGIHENERHRFDVDVSRLDTHQPELKIEDVKANFAAARVYPD